MLIVTKNPTQTIEFGRRISRFFKKGDVVALFGSLGTGKTTLVKGIAKGLGIRRTIVNSPSFVLFKEYKTKLPLYHFDFYRIKKAQDSYSVGLEEYLFSDGVCVIEWADRIKRFLPTEFLKIELKLKNTNQRGIRLTGVGHHYKDLIKRYEDFRN